MYAVIRAGGKQYRVAPGDIIKIEKTPAEKGRIEFTDLVAVSGQEGEIGRPGEGRVLGEVVEEGRHDKVLVFHYKRKKQYKRLRGHRQPFTAVRITEIVFDGQRFTAPEEPQLRRKETKAEAASSVDVHSASAAEATPESGTAKRKSKKTTASASAANKKSAARKSRKRK